MKRILFIFILFAPMCVIGQNSTIITNSLQAELDSKTNMQYTNVVLELNQQLDFDILNNYLDANNIQFPERANIVRRALENNAYASQQLLMSAIEQYESKNSNSYTNINTFWLCNMISIEASKDLIYELSNTGLLSAISLDYLSTPTTPISMNKNKEKLVDQAENSLKVINAHKLWQLGYTGKGRIHYSIDTGVWPDHPAIKRQFLANYLPLSKCYYNFDGPDNWPIDKSSDHGTHTIGTALGLDTANNDTIGIAFNARFIASDPVATSMATVKPISSFMYAFQFAFNPDGDTNTLNDIPDAINNSWGYDIPTNDSLCNSYISQMFLAIEAAGIANIFSAGNDGPGVQTIGIPAHINSNNLNIFSVGSINPNDTSYPISSFSARGPSICGGTGSQLIKPEVVAPGQFIRSAIRNNSYAEYQGTSMAAPHVSGATLLLKEAFPYLNGSDILNALFLSAHDLGTVGEDNTYGNGIIDVYAAFLLLSINNTPINPNLQDAYDIAIKCNNSENYYYCATDFIPSININNLGLNIIDSIEIEYGIVGQSLLSFSYNTAINPNSNTNIILPSININSTGYKEFYFRILSDTTWHETDKINNNTVYRTYITANDILPFTEDFENCIDDTKWIIENPDFNNITWDTLSTSGLNNSNISATMHCESGVQFNEPEHLITPSIDISNSDSLFLRFDIAYSKIHNSLTDSLLVSISSDCGVSWDSPIFRKGGDNLSTNDTIVSNFIPEYPTHWRTEKIDISQYCTNSNIMLRFTVKNRKGNYVCLDNIALYNESDPTSIKEDNSKNIVLYPNPSSDFINIDFGSFGEYHINIYSNSGKLMANYDINSINTKINIAKYPAGLYIVNVVEKNQSYSYSFIKE